jgi:hypothetical protein
MDRQLNDIITQLPWDQMQAVPLPRISFDALTESCEGALRDPLSHIQYGQITIKAKVHALNISPSCFIELLKICERT